jgi:hypothetical protein
MYILTGNYAKYAQKQGGNIPKIWANDSIVVFFFRLPNVADETIIAGKARKKKITRMSCLNFSPPWYCHFWDFEGYGCFAVLIRIGTESGQGEFCTRI